MLEKNFKLMPEEKAALKLRSLYENYGYNFYRMSRFEEYDFYADKKDFLTSKSILTFTDLNGKLMALRPDVTLSIIKHIKNSPGVQKFYYDEKVYRVPKNSSGFREISQAGVECLGPLNDSNIKEVLELALLSLENLADGKNFILDVAHAGMIAQLLEGRQNKPEILKCLAEKNLHELKILNAPEKLIALANLEGPLKNSLHVLDEGTAEIISSLEKIFPGKIHIDFSVTSNLNYYNGIIFRGFIEGVPDSVLSGGQYDRLMSLIKNQSSKAIGFAVQLGVRS